MGSGINCCKNLTTNYEKFSIKVPDLIALNSNTKPLQEQKTVPHITRTFGTMNSINSYHKYFTNNPLPGIVKIIPKYTVTGKKDEQGYYL